MRSALLGAVFLVFACGCGQDGTASEQGRLRLWPLHAALDEDRGGAIIDGLNRQVLLRGVNVNAFAEYWKSRDFPTTFPFGGADADLMAEIGWNSVRLLLSWSRVEPRPGVYDEAYLDEIEGAVETLAERGIYTIIDLHQDAWGATLAAFPNENCAEGTEPAFGWDGAPGWATTDGGAPRCTVAGLRELSPAVRNAWTAFWRDEPGPEGVGIRTRYAEMLGHIAGRFATTAAVAGYDVMNEPNAFGAAELAGLKALYEDSLGEIRAAEGRANGFPHLILFEPSVTWSAVGQGPPPTFEHDGGVVYAPHIYSGGFNNAPIAAEAFQIARDEAALFGGVPVLTGEWGSNPARASDPSDSYFLDHQQLQDEFLFGANLWTWRESCGDPHKAGEFRSGRVPEVWGEFEVDCRSNAIVGRRSDLIDQLRRPLLRAAPGRIRTVEYQAATGNYSASGSGANMDSELVLFYPAPTGASAPLSVLTSGLGPVSQSPAAGAGIILRAVTDGGAWTIQIAVTAG